MKYKTQLLFVTFTILTLTLFAADKKILIEIRAPDTVEYSHAGVEFVGEHTSAGTPLKQTKQTAEGATNVFSTSFIIYTSLYQERRFAIIVSPGASPKSMSQVFQLPIGKNPKPTNWSEWHRPDYLENAYVASNNFMDNQKSPDRSTNILGLPRKNGHRICVVH
jgi:hypothetical protein